MLGDQPRSKTKKGRDLPCVGGIEGGPLEMAVDWLVAFGITLPPISMEPGRESL